MYHFSISLDNPTTEYPLILFKSDSKSFSQFIAKNPDGYRGVSKAALQAYVNAQSGDPLCKGLDMSTIERSNFFDDKYLIGYDIVGVVLKPKISKPLR